MQDMIDGFGTFLQMKKSLYLIYDYISPMFVEYIQAAMDKATYEIIDDPEPF